MWDNHYCWNASYTSLEVWEWWKQLLAASTSSIWSIFCYFPWGEHSIYIQNIRFLVPSQHRKWDAMLQGETSIVAWVFPELCYMYINDWMRFWQHLRAPHGSHQVISSEMGSQIAYKIPDFGYPLSTENDMFSCKERHLLLIGWFMTFLRCMRMIGGVSNSIYKTLMAHTMLFPQCWVSNYTQNTRFWVPSQHRKWGPVLQCETTITAGTLHIHH